MDKSLHEQLTQLLMENGASVSKTSIDKLIEFIAERDASTISQCIKQVERTGNELIHNYNFGTKISSPAQKDISNE